MREQDHPSPTGGAVAPGLRRALAFLRNTPLHPQWFALRRKERELAGIGAKLGGTVLDIGCAEQKPRAHLPAGASYVGLDYYRTATEWYGTRPDVFGDAHGLPFPDARFDAVLLLDVLEHLRDPHACLAEVARVLRSGGTFVVQVPFLYPLHDAPLDFQRWTLPGLREIARRHGLAVVAEDASGNAIETAALLANLALARTAINGISRRRAGALLAPFVPFFVLGNNVMAWLLAPLAPRDDFMSHGFRLVMRKD